MNDHAPAWIQQSKQGRFFMGCVGLYGYTQKLDQFCKSITSQSKIKEIGEINITKQDKEYFRRAMSIL